jgi:serine/threonine protein kinase
LQPSNIFLNEQGQIKVGGLGKAKLPGYSFELFPPPAAATSDYLSPEQKAGAKNLAFASDIYSLGCILFGLLSGRVYTRQQPVTKVSALLIKGPEWLGPLILRMLSPIPAQRPADGGAVARLLRASGGPAETAPPAFPASQVSSVELLPDVIEPVAAVVAGQVQSTLDSAHAKIEAAQAKIEAAQAKIEQVQAQVAKAARRQPAPTASPSYPDLARRATPKPRTKSAVGLVVVIIFFIVLCIVLAILGRG